MQGSIRDEAEQLLYRYAERIDAGDFAGVGALFADAVLTMEDGTVIATGATEVEQLYRSTTKLHADGTPRTQHVITNVIVEPIDGPARRWQVRARFTVLQATDAVPLQVVAAGRYRDLVEHGDDGQLRIVEHGMIPQLWGDVSDHLLFDPR